MKADFLLAPSRYTAQKLIDVQNVPSEKIRRLAWPLNPSFARLADAPDDLPLPKRFPPGRVILTVGRWVTSERYKGVDDLIRAISQLRAAIPGLNLVAVGGGDDLPHLKELADALGVEDCVHFSENPSRAQLAGCYANAEIFALPSAGEGFGFVFLEAMAFAKPIVGAAAGGITDIVEDNSNGLLVPPRDPQRLLQALNCLLKDESLRKKLGQCGARVVRQKFGFEVFKNELQKILVECGLDSTPSA
jgi:glycosyltransferase involved in cell wall biosynthesis